MGHSCTQADEGDLHALSGGVLLVPSSVLSVCSVLSML